MNTIECKKDNCDTLLAKIDLTAYRIKSKSKQIMINN